MPGNGIGIAGSRAISEDDLAPGITPDHRGHILHEVVDESLGRGSDADETKSMSPHVVWEELVVKCDSDTRFDGHRAPFHLPEGADPGNIETLPVFFLRVIFLAPIEETPRRGDA